MFLQMEEKPWRQYTIWLLSTFDNKFQGGLISKGIFLPFPVLSLSDYCHH